MKLLRLAALIAATLLALGHSIGDAAIADETYGKTPFYEEGVAVSFVAVSRDGARVAFATDKRNVHIRETAAGNRIATLAVPSSLGEGEDYLHFMAFSPDGMRLVTVSRDKMARVWAIDGSRELVAFEHPLAVVTAVFSPDGALLVTVSADGVARMWDVAGGREPAVLQHPSRVTSVTFSADGTLLVACAGGTAHLWDVAGRHEIMVLQGHTEEVREARFSPDGTRIVTASSDGTARVWDAAGGREILVLTHSSPVSLAGFSADGTRLVTGAGEEAYVFDAASGREIAILRGHAGGVNVATFSPDGARIATGAHDPIVRVWEADSGAELAVLTGHNYAVEFAAFSPDGRRMFTAGGAQVIMWTRQDPASLPGDIAGLWFSDSGTAAQPLPSEKVRAMCVTTPISIRSDGLVVFFEATGNGEPPHAGLYMQCTSDLSCQIYSDEPAPELEPLGAGTLSFSGSTGKLCLTGDCSVIAHCPELVWTDEERNSGFAERWEAAVLGLKK